MTTAKFFSKCRGGIFGAAMSRQFAFMLFTFILLLLIVVVPLLVSDLTHPITGRFDGQVLEGNPQAIAAFYTRTFEGGIFLGGLAQALSVASLLSIVAFACALSSARHMHSMKMTDLFHSLPVRREKLLLTNLVTSMITVIGPLLLVTAGSTLGILLAYGRYGWVGPWFFGVIAMDFLTILLAVFVMYTFTTFIAVQVGTTFDALALTGTLGFMPTAIYLIGGGVWSEHIYGAVFNADWALRLSPFLFYFERVYLMRHAWIGLGDEPSYAGLIAVFAIWTLVGVGLFVGAIQLYKRRKSELAGQTQPQGRLQMIAKFFVAFLGGAMFMAIFFHHSVSARIIAIITATVVIGLIAELILSRGVRAIPRNAKWLAVAGVVYCLLYLGMANDVLGHSTRVPREANITAVSVSYRGRFQSETTPARVFGLHDPLHNTLPLTDPGSIAIVREVHQAIIDDYVRDRERHNHRLTRWGRGSHNLSVRYYLRTGGTFERRYRITNANHMLLTRLESQPDFIAANHPLFFMEDFTRITGRQMEVVAELLVVADRHYLTAVDPNALLSALREDMLRETLDEILNPVNPTVAYIALTYREPGVMERQWQRSGSVYRVRVLADTTIPLTEASTSTLGLLRDHGLSDLLRPGIEGVSEVIITDLASGNRSREQGRVVQLTPDTGRDFDHFYRLEGERAAAVREEAQSDLVFFSLTDPEDIAHVIGRGHTAMFIGEDAFDQVLVMHILGPDETLATRYILPDDLPLSIRGEAIAQMERRAGEGIQHTNGLTPSGLAWETRTAAATIHATSSAAAGDVQYLFLPESGS